MKEYKTLIGNDIPSSEQLDTLASDGWELVQIVPWFENQKQVRPGHVAIYLQRDKVLDS